MRKAAPDLSARTGFVGLMWPCLEVAIIDRGKIVFTGSSHQIRERIEGMSGEPSHPLEALFFQLMAGQEERKGLSWLR